MKKISYLLTAACTVWALTSCEADKDPVYHAPTEGSFTLYAPAMQDLYIELTEENTLELTTSGQPDYGYSAVAVYGAQMALSNDFSNPDKVYDLVPTNENLSKITLKQEDIAQGICELLGLDSEETYSTMFPDGFKSMPVYFRASCHLEGVEGSEVVSNVVSYNNILPYFAVSSPGYIYLVGNPEGWAGPNPENASHYASWRLFEPENAIGSKIYSGVFDLPAAPMFRFYTALTGWDDDSYGCQVDDNPIDFELVDGSFNHELIKGKGSYSFPDFPGGTVTIVVDMSTESAMTVTITTGEVSVFVPSYIWAFGNQFGDWTEPSEENAAALEPYRLVNSASAEAVYTASLPVAEGDIYFRFAYELAGWDGGTQWGIQEEDASILCEFSNNAFSGPYVNGKGSWQFVLPSDGKLNLAVDTENKTVSVEFVAD